MKKLVIAKAGMFSLNDEAYDKLGIKSEDDISRDDSRLVSLVSQDGKVCTEQDGSELTIVEIPDEATDWIVEWMDPEGLYGEIVTYVVDGNVKHAYAEYTPE